MKEVRFPGVCKQALEVTIKVKSKTRKELSQKTGVFRSMQANIEARIKVIASYNSGTSCQ